MAQITNRTPLVSEDQLLQNMNRKMSKRREHRIHIASIQSQHIHAHYYTQSAKELTFDHILYNTEIQLLPPTKIPARMKWRENHGKWNNIPIAVKQYLDAYATCHIIPIYFWPFFHSTPIFFNMFTFFFLGESSSMSSE